MVEIVSVDVDTAAFARIASTVARWWNMTAEEVEHSRRIEPTCREWLAVQDGAPIGAARCRELPDMKESAAAFGEVWVLADQRRKGVGTTLFSEVAEHARALGKSELELFTFADDPDGVSYLEHRGFSPVMSLRSLRLVLANCTRPDGAPPQGITITTLADRPELAHELWDTACEVVPDIPYDGDVPLSPGTFEEFTQYDLSGPSFMPEATFLAMVDGTIAGYGQLHWSDREGGIAFHGMLGVRRRHRGRGIASALKATQIAWAIDHGLTELRTANEARNTAARAVNAKFPYEAIPDEVLHRGPIPAL